MTPYSRTLRLAPALAVTLLLLTASCAPSGPKLHPVQGQLFFKDRAAEGASVVFHPVEGGPRASGTVGADGRFTLTTHPYGDGAPAGEYVVLVTWYPPNARELDNPSNKLPARYADLNQPLLKASVKEGPNELPPFRLK